jgi:hypothetical protein
VSDSLIARVDLGRREIARLVHEFEVLIGQGLDRELDIIETAAVASMLHSFYTEIEKILKMIAQDIDKRVPSGEFWHRDLLDQMSRATENRPRIISIELQETLKEYLAFRHVFRGGSVVLMRWDKMKPLARNAGSTLQAFDAELDLVLRSLGRIPPDTRE